MSKILSKTTVKTLALFGLLALAAAPASAQFRNKLRLNSSKPDLVVAGIGFGPTGEIAYTITNTGPVSTGLPFVADVYINGVLRQTVKHEALAAKRNDTKLAPRAFFPGAAGGKVKVVVDPQFIVAEWSENNNSRDYLVVQPPLPDLAIHGAYLRQIGDRYHVVIVVGNLGIAASRASSAARVLTKRGGLKGFKAGLVNVPPLDPGKFLQIVTGVSFGSDKPTKITVHLDVYDNIGESDETNNSLTFG